MCGGVSLFTAELRVLLSKIYLIRCAYAMIIFFVMAETFVYTTDLNDIRLSWQNFYRGINLLLLRTTYLLFVFQKMSETIYGNFARGES